MTTAADGLCLDPEEREIARELMADGRSGLDELFATARALAAHARAEWESESIWREPELTEETPTEG